jgi:hypothetical protein
MGILLYKQEDTRFRTFLYAGQKILVCTSVFIHGFDPFFQFAANWLHSFPFHVNMTIYERRLYKVNHYAKGCSNALLIWGTIASNLALLFILLLIPEISQGALTADELPGVLIALGILLLAPGIMMITGGIRMKVNNRRNFCQFKEQYTAPAHELTIHFMSYANCPISPEYTNPRILIKLLNLLHSGITNSIQESLNHLMVSVNQSAMAQHLEQTRQNTVVPNQTYDIRYIFIPSKFFK